MTLQRNPSFALFSATLLAAVLVGVLIPMAIPYDWLVEGGMIEDATVILYGLAIVAVIAAPMRNVSWIDKTAVCLLLAAFAAREMDLHTSLFGISILKARFYNRYGTPPQIAVALAILLPVFASLLWLAIRHGRRWLPALRRAQPAAQTFLFFLLALFVSKACDRLPDTLNDTLHVQIPQAAFYVSQSIEECLELLLPLLAAAVVWQAGAPARRQE